MQQIKTITIFFLLCFISSATSYSRFITECEKLCPIEPTASSFDEDKASGMHNNLSLCLLQNECHDIDDCSKMLTKHYCHTESCTVTCDDGMCIHSLHNWFLLCYTWLLCIVLLIVLLCAVAESETTSVTQRTRTKRIVHVHFHYHGRLYWKFSCSVVFYLLSKRHFYVNCSF